ncbi:MAG: NAD(P)H-hydrate dehydratase [Candidatus Omnitrophica bacterium]|nr:NAD(P)H-hydrate dehydratase [Candidatus Omnitrophota bacterium]
MNDMEQNISKLLPVRKKEADKRDCGHVFVLAGSESFTGAAALCSKAVLLSGAGLVTLGIPESLSHIMAIKLTEVIIKALPETRFKTLSLSAKKEILHFGSKCNCLIIGPGLSRNEETAKLVRSLIAESRNRIVLDADGINALEGNSGILKRRREDIVITPHVLEFSRLSGLSIEEIKKNRITLAKKFIMQYNSVFVLKGFRTIVARRNRALYVNSTGNSGMATAGSGDVLTGIIGGFLAQGLESFDAAKLAVYLHGLAGDLAAREKTEYSLIASDILNNLPKAIKKLLNC